MRNCKAPGCPQKTCIGDYCKPHYVALKRLRKRVWSEPVNPNLYASPNAPKIH